MLFLHDASGHSLSPYHDFHLGCLGARSIKTVEILNVTIEGEHTIVIAACWAKHGPKKESELEFFKFQFKDLAQAQQWRTNVLGHVYKGKNNSFFFEPSKSVID